LLNVNTVLKWLLIALLIYTALPILFEFFHGLKALPLPGYILNPLKKMGLVLELLPDLITILVIIFVFRYVLKGFTTKCEIEKERITGLLSRLGKPHLPDCTCHCFCFYVNRNFPYLPGSDSPILEAYLFLWIPFHFWFSRITF
jgi:hypothetical protein